MWARLPHSLITGEAVGHEPGCSGARRGQYQERRDALPNDSPFAPPQECRGSLSLTRGHLGDYEFNATADGKSRRQMHSLENEGPNPTLQFP